jgi:glutathione peroxidase
MNSPIHSFKIGGLDGAEIDFERLRGQVLLLVNTASECGFTPQYAGLQKLHETYRERGLAVIGFPCNQFGGQEPGEAAEIGEFCRKNYGVDFLLSEKIEVNGENAHPIFKYLTDALPGALGTRAVKWNFTKFLLDREGKPVRRYGSMDKPEKIAGDIEALL